MESLKIEHIGIVVKDIDQVTESWSTLLGIGPWTVREIDRDTVKFKMAFASLGSVRIELVQPVEGRIFHSGFLDEYGEGLHHLGFTIDNLDEVLSSLVTRGAKVVNSSQGSFAYIETGGPGGVLFELIQRRP
jgi:methylmalonyl-CoA/ethylmalonyl-CoA epimerase